MPRFPCCDHAHVGLDYPHEDTDWTLPQPCLTPGCPGSVPMTPIESSE